MFEFYDDFRRKLIMLAESDKDIKAITAIGSSVRSASAADEFSDLDIIIASDDTEKWLYGDYPHKLGDVNISFVEPTLGGGMERRCIYSGDKDVDMIIFTPAQFETAIKDGTAGFVMNRGYRVLYDSCDFTRLIEQYVTPTVNAPQITEDEFINIVNDFFFHIIWAYKKTLRGEIWSAKMSADNYLKHRLLRILELYCSSEGKDVWHDGRFLDTWADKSILDELSGCFARYDADEIRTAIERTFSLFVRVSEKYAEAVGYAYPESAKKCAQDYISHQRAKN